MTQTTLSATTNIIERQLFLIVPSLLIVRDSKILLLKRGEKTIYHPGHWHCPTGMMEAGETPQETIIRETFEEVGLRVNPELGTTILAKRPFHPRWQFQVWMLFVTQGVTNEPINKEPDKHPLMDWFDPENLPTPIIPMVKDAIKQWLKNKTYGEFDYGQ